MLFGSFEDKFVYGLLASVGVILASVYMIRVFQRVMHNRVGPAVKSREIDGLHLAAVAPIVAVVIALGLYPQLRGGAHGALDRRVDRAGRPARSTQRCR